MSSTPPPSKEDPPKPSSADKIRAQLAAKLAEAEEAIAASEAAKKQADATDDLEERAVLLEESAKQDKRAKAAMKAANRLQSGVWQGGAGGAGIGAGVGAGIGSVVGTVVGGVAAIPTTLVGGLVGIGTGAVHGPWIKMPNKWAKEGEDGEIVTEEEDEKVLNDGKE